MFTRRDEICIRKSSAEIPIGIIHVLSSPQLLFSSADWSLMWSPRNLHCERKTNLCIPVEEMLIALLMEVVLFPGTISQSQSFLVFPLGCVQTYKFVKELTSTVHSHGYCSVVSGCFHGVAVSCNLSKKAVCLVLPMYVHLAHRMTLSRSSHFSVHPAIYKLEIIKHISTFAKAL